MSGGDPRRKSLKTAPDRVPGRNIEEYMRNHRGNGGISERITPAIKIIGGVIQPYFAAPRQGRA